MCNDPASNICGKLIFQIIYFIIFVRLYSYPYHILVLRAKFENYAHIFLHCSLHFRALGAEKKPLGINFLLSFTRHFGVIESYPIFHDMKLTDVIVSLMHSCVV